MDFAILFALFSVLSSLRMLFRYLQIGMGSSASGDDDYTICRDDGIYPDDIPVPHPLPMPEYGGYFAPLIEYIPESVQASSGFHRYRFYIAIVCLCLTISRIFEKILIAWKKRCKEDLC